MFPIEWWPCAVFSILLIFVASALIGFKFAGRVKLSLLRRSLRLICVLLGLLSSFVAVLFAAVQGCETHSHSSMIYSPSGKTAARIDMDDAGAIGGSASVELFWAHGFRQAMVFSGDWGTVEPSDIRWESDSELLISYDGTIDSCHSTNSVKVTCSAKRR